jgi:hypothetical protein
MPSTSLSVVFTTAYRIRLVLPYKILNPPLQNYYLSRELAASIRKVNQLSLSLNIEAHASPNFPKSTIWASWSVSKDLETKKTLLLMSNFFKNPISIV